MRGAQQCGRAQPKHDDRYRQQDGGEQKADAGEHCGDDSAVAGTLRGPSSQMERGDVLGELGEPRSPPRIRLADEDTASAESRLLKLAVAGAAIVP